MKYIVLSLFLFATIAIILSPPVFSAIPPTTAFDTIRANGTDVTADSYKDILKLESDGSILISGIDTPNTGASPFKDWNYKKKLTLNSTMIDGDLTDFPVLISITDNDLKWSGLGGRVEHVSGGDIIFFKDDFITEIPYERQSYNLATGQLIAWVKTDVLNVTDVDIYIGFGNTDGIDHANPTAVWDDNYLAVYHMDGTGTDSTQYDHDLTNSGAFLASGIVNTALEFDGVSDYMTDTDFIWLASDPDITFELWNFWDSSSTTANQAIASWGATTPDRRKISAPWQPIASNDRADMFWTSTSQAARLENFGASYGDSWQHLVFDTGIGNLSPFKGRIFVNGTNLEDAGGLEASFTPEFDSTTGLQIGMWLGSYLHDGIMDEIRISNIVRSADYTSTNYKMQNDPDSFVTVGTLENMLDEDTITLGVAPPSNSTVGGIFADSCPSGQYVTAIQADGSISCVEVDTGSLVPQKIGHTKLNASATEISVTNLPHRDWLKIHAKLFVNGTSSENPRLQFNNDTNTSYAYRVSSSSGSSQTFISLSLCSCLHDRMIEILVDNHAGETKATNSFETTFDNGTSTTTPQIFVGGGIWNNVASIESIKISVATPASHNYLADSLITVYGWDDE